MKDMFKIIRVCFSVLLFLPMIAFAQAENTLDLEKAVALALERNLTVQLSDLNVELAKENERQALFSLLPTLNGFGSHGYNWGQTIDPFTNQFASSRVRNNSFSLSSNVTLFGGLAQQNTLAQRKAEKKASELELEQSKNSIAINVSQTFLQVVYNGELLRISEEQKVLSEQQYDRVKQQHDLGQVAKATLLDIEAQLANDELSVTNAKNIYLQSRLQFMQLIQATEDEAQKSLTLPNLEQVNAKMVRSTPSEIFQEALIHLPDVKATEYRLKASEKGLNAARGGYMPRLSVNASYGTGYSGNNRLPATDPRITIDTSQTLFTESGGRILEAGFVVDEFKTKAFKDQINDNLNQSVSFTMQVPLFNGNQIRSGVRRSKIGVLQNKIQLDQAKNTLRQQVETAWNDALAAYQRLLSSEKAESAQQQAFNNAKIRFEQNLITSVDFNDFKVRLARAQADLIQAKVDYIFKTKVLDFYRGETLTINE